MINEGGYIGLLLTLVSKVIPTRCNIYWTLLYTIVKNFQLSAVGVILFIIFGDVYQFIVNCLIHWDR